VFRGLAGRLGITSAHYGEALFALCGFASSTALCVQTADACKHGKLRPLPALLGATAHEGMRTSCLILGTSLLTFRALGGRYFSLLPSDYASLGAFRSAVTSTPAGLDYADSRHRGAIEMAGRVAGCHTCGTRRAAVYIADHQPPLKLVKRQNAGFLRRRVLGPVSQSFFPQCAECSLVQSRAVRLEPSKRPLHYHLSTFRPYHLTGAVLAGLWWMYTPRY
jgi:hypothetical protein